MRKLLLFLFILIVSCEKDEIILAPQPEPIVYVFDNSNTIISNGTEIIINLNYEGTHSLTIENIDGVISREQFQGTIGDNTLTIYTSVLPKGPSTLILENESGIVDNVSIIIQ
jgi:hypothetical protein